MPPPPTHVSDTEVLAAVRRHWSDEVDGVVELPAAPGTGRWQATVRGAARLHVTLDPVTDARQAARLEGAYAAAAALAFALDAVVAGLRGSHGTHTLPLAGGALSVTPWVWAEPVTDAPPTDGPLSAGAVASATARALRRLHAARPPHELPTWEPEPVGPGHDLAARLDAPGGPLVAQAREVLRRHADDVDRWTTRYLALADAATTDTSAWVTTHGRPHGRHRLRALTGRLLLVGWESARLAPPERDLGVVATAPDDHSTTHTRPLPDPRVLEMFDLERRLHSLARHTDHLAAPPSEGTVVGGAASALAGLRFELGRPATPGAPA